MKKSLLKDMFREIWRSKNRFLSIFGIIALGVGFFAGVKVTCPDMKITADQYYEDNRLMDIRLISTMGFNQNDLAFIERQSGIAQMEAAYSSDFLVNAKGIEESITKVFSFDCAADLSQMINQPMLIEGRLPQTSGECVIDAHQTAGLKIGDTITLSSGSSDSELSDTLKRSEYTIVGTVNSPMYINFQRGSSALGDGKVDFFLMLPKEDFSLEVYTDVYLTLTDTRGLSSFDDQYQVLLDNATQRLEDAAPTRTKERLNEIQQEALAELDDGKQELADQEKKANDELAKAKQELDDGKAEYASSKQKTEQELADAKKKLEDSEKELKAGQVAYEENRKQFENTIAAAQTKIDQAKAQIEAQIQQNPDSAPLFAQALKELAEQQTALDAQKQSGQAELDAAKAKLEAGQKELEQGKASYEEGRKTAQKELSKAQQKLTDGEKTYQSEKAKAEKEIQDAKDEIAQAEQEIMEIEEPVWYITDRNLNPGYGDYETDTGRVDAIAAVFPVFFILVAALVCLTTMTRMVEEQRTQIGVLKAIGYGKGDIAFKFLVYAALASLLGSVIGLLIGFYFFPTIIFNAYKIMYIMPPVITPFHWDYVFYCTLAALLCTVLSSLAACYAALHSVPAQLMRPKAPKAGKRVLLERITPLWSRLNFSYKVTFRNLFRYKKRVLMTIVGVAGCTALMLTGFGLRHAITSISDLQYQNIFHYDVMGVADDANGKTPMPEIEKILKEQDSLREYLITSQKTVDVTKDSVTKNVNLWVPNLTDTLDQFITLSDPGTGQALTLGNDGAIINEKLASLLDAKVGDTIQIHDASGALIDIKVAGITKNYTLNYIYLSAEYYQAIYEKEPSYNSFVALNNLEDGASEETVSGWQEDFSQALMNSDDLQAISYTSDVKGYFDDLFGSLNYIVLVVILSAGALAFIVLYNLTNINVNERIRELATIKVLGFYDLETSAYIYRENILSTLLGIAIGLVGGVFLNHFVVVTSEVDAVMFARDIDPLSFILAAVLTMMFTLIVNITLHFKLKKLDMTSSLKSVE